jgi:ubiquinone/menaquinone biosynthesis C-methylase UbiE
MAPDGPRIQSYTALAHDYDETRYTTADDALKEGFRWRALRALFPARSVRALDVACGTGRGVVILQEVASSVCGVDGTMEMLQVAQQKIRRSKRPAAVCQANAASLPFAPGTFDLITCLNFVHLFEPDHKQVFVREIGRVLRPGGTAIVEFDNALQGGVLGVVRKYGVKDIGYDWPWVMRRCFPPALFTITAMHGTNLPGLWRVRPLHGLERLAGSFPLNYLAARMFIRAVRR